MQSITPHKLSSAFHNRLDRVRESFLDPGVHTALVTVVACLEMLMIVLWTKTTNDLAFPWFELTFFALLGWINSPLWPSTIVCRLYEGIEFHRTINAYLMFAVPVYFVYLAIFVFD